MPAYISLSCTFPYESFHSGFVSQTYEAFFKNGFSFKKGYWTAKDMSLEEIIKWNTHLFQKKFKLGFTEHVANDYKQIELYHSVFEEARLYYICSTSEDTIRMTLIVKESDIFDYEDHRTIKRSNLKILDDLAIDLWRELNPLRPLMIQSYGEEALNTYWQEFKNGEVKEDRYIIVNKKSFENFIHDLPEHWHVSMIDAYSCWLVNLRLRSKPEMSRPFL